MYEIVGQQIQNIWLFGQIAHSDVTVERNVSINSGGFPGLPGPKSQMPHARGSSRVQNHRLPSSPGPRIAEFRCPWVGKLFRGAFFHAFSKFVRMFKQFINLSTILKKENV